MLNRNMYSNTHSYTHTRHKCVPVFSCAHVPCVDYNGHTNHTYAPMLACRVVNLTLGETTAIRDTTIPQLLMSCRSYLWEKR